MKLQAVVWSRLGVAVACVALWLSACDSPQPGPAAASATEACPLGEAVTTDGQRRLALVIGVGDYVNPDIPDLKGPPNDARAIYELLTDPHGYGFPKKNVCLLLDGAATTANVQQMFRRALIDRAQGDDVTVVYFAGHGSQRKDQNGDEPDGLDETWVLHDSRTESTPDLLDDRVNAWLAELHRKTSHITVVLDSCNSGTATRGETGYVARFVKPDETPLPPGAQAAGDGSAATPLESLPGLVVLTAASDGTSALEKGGHGLFTDALLSTLAEGQVVPLTYRQIARRVPPLIAAASNQIPYFQGDLAQPVFGHSGRLRPVAWEVKAVDGGLRLGGPPLPGLGVGAELRLYDGAASGAETRDPALAKGTVRIEEISGLEASARMLARAPGAPEVALGDLAVLVRPEDGFLKIKVRLRPADEPAGIPAERAAALRAAIARDADIGRLVEVVDTGDDFELSLDGKQVVVVRDIDGRVRNTIERDALVPEVLWSHARQRALLQLRGEGGSDFTDNQTLQLRLVPAAKQTACADVARWTPAKDPNQEQVVPLCFRFRIEVKLADDAPKPLLIGALLLASDGSIYGMPKDGRAILLKPGERYTFHTTYEGRPPLDVREMVAIFGTQENNPVAWSSLTNVVQTRSVTRSAASNPLQRALFNYVTGERSAPVTDEVEDTTWTRSVMPIRVEANAGFAEGARSPGTAFNSREYTIPKFDIRPYLPDDPDAALGKVLREADWLARYGGADGVGYKQHAWNQGSDDANLALGIDCSRAIWFTFTRAGLPYNRSNSYLSTAEMVSDHTLMRDEFRRCDGYADQRLGDILVYRDEARGDGHVVMVVDPVQRIAWGSHGWDGNAKALNIPVDRGVEYQKIKFKPDWAAWDRPGMALEACWRFKRFETERMAGRGLPGTQAMADACDPDACRLNK